MIVLLSRKALGFTTHQTTSAFVSSKKAINMQISALFQKFGRDLGYLCVIGGLLGWIWMDGRRQEVWNQIIAKDLRSTENIFAHHNDRVFYEIKKNIVESTAGDSLIIESRLAEAQMAVQEFLEYGTNLRSELVVYDPKNGFTIKRSLTEKDIDGLSVALSTLRDTLLACVDYDELTASAINHLLSMDSSSGQQYWKVAKQLKSKETWMLLEDLILKSRLAYAQSLIYLVGKTSPPTPCFTFFPCAFTEKSVLRPGETYRAEIYLSRYYNALKHTTVFVNGKLLPIEDGLAHFAQQYTTPGEKKYRVEIQIKNPVTKDIHSFKKEFNLIVVDTCR